MAAVHRSSHEALLGTPVWGRRAFNEDRSNTWFSRLGRILFFTAAILTFWEKHILLLRTVTTALLYLSPDTLSLNEHYQEPETK